MTSGIDWVGLMRTGLNVLRLQPAEFWRLTPLELRVMLGADDAAAPLTRDRLNALVRAYPDKKKDDPND